jgi:hypothetical protein
VPPAGLPANLKKNGRRGTAAASLLVLHMAPYTKRAEVITANFPENYVLHIPPLEKN